MFNKRDQIESESDPQKQQESSREFQHQPSAAARETTSAPTRGQAAIIGPSISINGQLSGDEDLIIEGRVKGTVQLKKHTLTVGSQGTLDAEVYANTILVDGTVNGDLYASERISIRKSAKIDGNILAPRISLEDGARFRGSIDMDAESEAFRKVFGSQAGSKSAGPTAVATGGGKSSGSPDKAAEKSESRAESRGGQRELSGQTGKAGGSAA
ncbi:MAG: polymer-forming cytoskeletal protein [Wenzhouxiangellaceae bacterium]|nr:polymer-forming cytoskeletal protein [Wenzhouxiangellaceae bacterium]